MEELSAMLRKKPIRSARVEWAEKQGIILIFNPSAAKLFVLRKKTAIDIWQMCNGRSTVNEMIASIAKKYNEDRSQVQRDTIDFVKKLIDKELVNFF